MYTNTANRYEGVLSDIMASTDTAAKVLTTDGGPSSPAYLIIEPDVPEQVEIVLFDGTFDSTTFRTTSLSNRYLEGSAAAEGIDHPSGSKVISGPLSQIIDDLHDAIAAAVPTGAIMMWSGSIASIPSGYALCDGGNGTPDLRNRFLVGAGSSYSPGDVGGASNVALNTAQLPSHAHGSGNLTGGNHSHGSGNLDTDSDSHSHSFERTEVERAAGNFRTRYPVNTSGNVASVSVTSDSHSHNVAGNTSSSSSNVSGNTASTGSGSSHENRPPYYALAFIMKL